MSKHTVAIEVVFLGHTEQEDADQAIYELLDIAVRTAALPTDAMGITALTVSPTHRPKVVSP